MPAMAAQSGVAVEVPDFRTLLAAPCEPEGGQSASTESPSAAKLFLLFCSVGFLLYLLPSPSVAYTHMTAPDLAGHVDVDDQGRTALWLAAHEGHCSVIKTLCLHKDLMKDAYDESGKTALMSVTESGKDLKKAEALVAGGADLKLVSPSDGRNALAIAFSASNCPTAALLLKAGSELSLVVAATKSSILLELKKGLDDMIVCYYGED